MKSFVISLLSIMLAIGFSVGYAEGGLGLEEMTTEELVSLRETIDAEIEKRRHEELAASIQNPFIEIYEITTTTPNSAGGVGAHVQWQNISSETFKYIYFTAVPYNAVGDLQKSEIGGRCAIDLKSTGPINPGMPVDMRNVYLYNDRKDVSIYGGDYWENLWYNSSIRKAKITAVRIVLMDGFEIEYNEDEVDALFVAPEDSTHLEEKVSDYRE